MKRCFREPIPELFDAARYLDAALSAHLVGRTKLSYELIELADMPVIREWTESIWGARSPYVTIDTSVVASRKRPPIAVQAQRMPSNAQKEELRLRDGYHCRFCHIPVVRSEIRVALKKLYPDALKWGQRNNEQHAALQAMWLQYDHVLPHAYGGDNNLENLVVTCAPCNFGRNSYSLAEAGLEDPRDNPPIHSWWDGLERLLQA